LPTFVAKSFQEANCCGFKALFAMPLLDWKAPTIVSVATARFWIYWAVTIPLTAAVLLLWSTWYLLFGSQHAQDLLKRRKKSRKSSSSDKAREKQIFMMCGLDRLREKSRGLV
jgi:hypothetical protein